MGDPGSTDASAVNRYILSVGGTHTRAINGSITGGSGWPRAWGALLVTIGTYGLLLELALGPVRLAPLRVLLALPALLVLPGWALDQAFFADPERDVAERCLTVVGLSIAAAICVGILLDITAGITTGSWIASLALVTLAGQALGWSRSGEIDRAVPHRLPRAPAAAWIAALLALAIAVTAVAISVRSANRQVYPGFTQMWLLPQGSAVTRFDLGVHSYEHGTVTYSVQLFLRGRRSASYRPIRLRPGATWGVTVVDPTATLPLAAVLYRDGRPYRKVAIKPPCPGAASRGLCNER
jgi:hypothetical protein